MSNQDNINSFLDSMDFDSTPAAEAPSPQSVPFTPAAVWSGEEPAQQTAAAAPVQAEPVPAAQPTAQPAAPQEAIPTPTAGVLFLWVCRDSREAAQGVQPLVAAKPPYRSAGKSPCAEISPRQSAHARKGV